MLNIGNPLALIALLAWPAVVIVLFRALTLERALIWSILGGYMVLPQLSEINLPLIPAFDKVTIPNLTAFVACVAIWGRMPAVMPASVVGKGLMLAFLLSPSFTVLTNLSPLIFGRDSIGGLTVIELSAIDTLVLPGLRIYDAASVLAKQLLLMLPFFLARKALRTEAAMREILIALLVAGVLYAPLMLFETRFSPQLHTWVYGFFQHDFIQAMRAGGFRPFVFMPHGLWVAFFAFMVLMAAAALWRSEGRRSLWGGAIIFGLGLVAICKSMGAIVFSVVLLPIALLMRPRGHLTLAVLVSVVVMAYPALRGLGLIPTGALVARVAEISPDRAQSLEYRFTMEDRVLVHAESRPVLGWGSWGRFFPRDPETGRSDVVVDGIWILTIGSHGWLGYTALFGLLALPLWSLWWQSRLSRAPPPVTVTILALVLTANMVDLIPNATLIPFTWLIAGALLGHAEEIARLRRGAEGQDSARRRANLVLGRAGPAAGRQAGPRSIL